MNESPIKGFVVWSKRAHAFFVKVNDTWSEHDGLSLEIATISNGTKLEADQDVTFFLREGLNRTRTGQILGSKLYAFEVKTEESHTQQEQCAHENCTNSAILLVTITDVTNNSTQSSYACIQHLDWTKTELKSRIPHEEITINTQELYEENTE